MHSSEAPLDEVAATATWQRLNSRGDILLDLHLAIMRDSTPKDQANEQDEGEQPAKIESEPAGRGGTRVVKPRAEVAPPIPTGITEIQHNWGAVNNRTPQP